MWVHPIKSLLAIAGEAIGYAKSGHTEAPLFFNGAIIQGDPGVLFYPITYLWRTTPVVLIGLGLAAAGLAVPGRRLFAPPQRRTVAVLAGFALLFTLLMTLGAKKFDRYLLAVYAPLDLVAAMGWLAGAGWLKRRSTQFAGPGALTLIGLSVGAQAAMIVPAFPYYFSYYNPLLGGTTKAPEVMMLGWGEGLDQAARYLNAMPNAKRLQVTTWFWNGPFSYFFEGRILAGPLTPHADIGRWLDSDYSVLYINQRQRGRLPRELLDSIGVLTPVKVIRIQGLEYAHIYDLRKRGEGVRSTSR